MIHEELKKEITVAMKARDAVKLSVVRDLVSSFVNELVTLGKKPEEFIDDENALKVIRRKVNQRKDSIEQYGKAGREDLVAQEKAELDVLETYLPAQMSDSDLEAVVIKTKESLGISDMKDMGRLIGAVIKEVGSDADGSRVQVIVRKVLG